MVEYVVLGSVKIPVKEILVIKGEGNLIVEIEEF